MEWILIGDLLIFIGGFMFGSLWQRSRRTQREPDSLKAGASCLPDVVKSESNLPA